MRLELELAVQDVEGVAVAAALRPDRIELCAALALGGLTPSRGLLEAALAAHAAGGPPVHVLVRPRAGDFDYSPAEMDVILHDARHAVAAGAAGVVIGMTRDGLLDLEAIARVRDAVAGEVTVHRAVDLLADPVGAVAAVAELGVDRVLTSGGAATALEGVRVIREMVEVSAGRLAVMAGSGVRPEQVALLAATGISAVHASASVRRRTPTTVALGRDDDGGHDTTDPRVGALFLDAVRQLGR